MLPGFTPKTERSYIGHRKALHVTVTSSLPNLRALRLHARADSARGIRTLQTCRDLAPAHSPISLRNWQEIKKKEKNKEKNKRNVFLYGPQAHDFHCTPLPRSLRRFEIPLLPLFSSLAQPNGPGKRRVALNVSNCISWSGGWSRNKI